MKFLPALFLLLALPAAVFAQGLAPTSETPITIGNSYSFRSVAMAQKRKINVYLPAKYTLDTASKYPVLYVIDGGVEQDFQHIAALANLGGLSAMYPDMIVVGIETIDRRNELTTPTTRKDYLKEIPTLGGAAKFRAMIADEIIPYVDANYRTDGKRIVVGESLAGYFIVDTLLQAPQVFTDYIAISPSMWWDELDAAKAAPAALAKHDAARRSLYLTVANEGGNHQKGNDLIAGALKQSALPNLRWTYVPRPNEEHSTIYHGAALDALRWLFPKGGKK